MDAVGQEARHASREDMWAHEERERDWNATSRAAKRRGMEVSSRTVSFSEGEMERGATLPPPSPLCRDPSPHRDVVPLRTRSTVIEC
jgi:hypothetical protein